MLIFNANNVNIIEAIFKISFKFLNVIIFWYNKVSFVNIS